MWQCLLGDDLEHLTLFRETVEEFIKVEEKRELGALSPEALERLADNHPHWWQDIIGQRFRASFLVALLSVVEVHLVRLCDAVRTIASTPVGRSDLKGQNILEQSKKFLQAFGHFRRPSARSWAYVRDLYHVRNCIIHHQGMVAQYRSAPRIRAFIEENNHIRLESDSIDIEPPFCTAAVEGVTAFFDDLKSEVVELCERASQFGA
jgi:hypothetical protein